MVGDTCRRISQERDGCREGSERVTGDAIEAVGGNMGGEDGYVRANGIDVFYREQGERRGDPLVLLHGGAVSSSDVWAEHAWGWHSHMATFARHFRVIAPDTRGHGRTVNARNPAGEMTYAALADDVKGLLEALGLERPLVCGFSDGGITASVVEMRHPGTWRAIVNHAGFDVFGPHPPSVPRIIKGWGGSAEATYADPEHMERRFGERDWFKRMKHDHGPEQGADYWKTQVEDIFRLWTAPVGYMFEDVRTVQPPTLVLVGDRDQACSVEDALTTLRMLPQGELCVLPRLDHAISALSRDMAVEFLLRQRGDAAGGR
jgi:pimeloyl-ACP methyl ester carboxylesterase